MYADKRLEKPSALATPPAAVMLPTPIAEMHTHGHAHPLAHTHAHLHTLHSQHMQHMQMQHLQQQQQQQQQPHVNQQQHVVQHLAPHSQHPQQQQQQQLTSESTTQSGLTMQHQHQQQQHQHNAAHQQHVAAQQQQAQQQQQSTMFTRFDANKSTKGASKLRRDLINAEIANLRDLLPLPQSTRQRLSQLQLMALVCVYVRKANYFQQVFKRHDISVHHAPTPNIGFSKALSGFLMMLTQNGKLLYISDNAAEYLGHSMEDLLIHGDSVYDIIDKQDHAAIQAELNRNVPPQPGQHASATSAAAAAAAAIASLEGEHRMFLCRMNVSRNARRQMRFGDQKVVLVQGHYLSYLPLCSRNEPVFLATCTPIAMPETRECVVQGATNVFTTIHSMDMKIAHIDKNGEFHLGYTKSDIQGLSWYNLLHSDNLREAQSKHRLITQSEQDRSCILLVRMQRRQGDFIWVHVVLQVRDSQDSNQQPVIVCTNQVLNEREASVMLANSWLYHYYSVQSKIQFGLAFEAPSRVPPTTPAAAAAAAVYYHQHAHHPHPHSHPHATTATPLPALVANVAGGYSTLHSPAHQYAHVAHHSHAHHHHHHHAQHQQATSASTPTPPHHQYHHMAAYGAYHTTVGGSSSGGGGSVGSGMSTTSGSGSAEGSPAPQLTATQSQQQHMQLQQQHQLQSNGLTASSGTVLNGVVAQQYIYHTRLGLEPVDYSQMAGGANGARTPRNNNNASNANSNGQGELRCSSTNSSVSSHATLTPHYIVTHSNAHGGNAGAVGSGGSSNAGPSNSATHQRSNSPPAKRRAVGKLEPLYLPDDVTEEPPSTITDINTTSYHLQPHTIISAPATDTHASVVFATVVPTRPRLLQKSLPNETPDFIDQWNPSPPWSEAAQKISLDSSSSTQQELSPCITTTPPTPTSAPPNGLLQPLSSNCNGTQTIGPAFSFEWMSDALVPVTTDPYVSCITPPDGLPIVMAHHHHHPHASAQHALHWTGMGALSAAPTEHHQHLSQHLASRGHRLLSLGASGALSGGAQQSAVLVEEKVEVAKKKEDKESPHK